MNSLLILATLAYLVKCKILAACKLLFNFITDAIAYIWPVLHSLIFGSFKIKVSTQLNISSELALEFQFLMINLSLANLI